MASQENKNFVDNMVDAHKQAVDTLVENTKKVSNGNAMVNDTIQKGSEWYKNWLDNQKNIFSQTTGQATNATEKVKENTSKMNEFYQNWLNSQMNWTKQMWDMNQNWMTNNMNATTTTDGNIMNMWNNWSNQWQNWMTNMAAHNWMNQWQQQAQNMNPFSANTWKNANENWTGIFNQYYEMLNNNFADWQKNFQNSTVQDAYRNMVNVTDGFTRFYEMWSPMWKSIQDKTFTTDTYKQWANPALYKDLMDKYFGFMPENGRQYMQQATDLMNNAAKQMGHMGMNNYQQMRNMMTSMPGMNAGDMFGGMLNSYNTWHGMMNNAVAPLTKMMTPNQYTKSMMEWNDITNRIMVYNIKNAELQYMIYNQGTKVMDSLAENITSKLENGEEVNSMMALYQEWLNISDKVYVSLFESDEYSQLMAEVSAMQLKLRKDIEMQMEKLLAGVPVATRSEIDELYKTIYDLKKQVREMERSMQNHNEVAATATAPAEDANGNAARRPAAKKA